MPLPSKREIVNAVEALQSDDNLPRDNQNIILLLRAVESSDLCHFVEDLCPELRPEDHTSCQHHNPGITALREVMWASGRLQEHQLGCKMDKKGPRLGFNQWVWKRQRGFSTMHKDFPWQADGEVFAAIGALDTIADGRTGALETANPKRSTSGNGVSGLIKGVLIYETQLQIAGLKAERDRETTTAIQKGVLQEPVRALESFCRQFRDATIEDVEADTVHASNSASASASARARKRKGEGEARSQDSAKRRRIQGEGEQEES